MSDPIAELIRFEFDLTGTDDWLDDVAAQIRQQIGRELLEQQVEVVNCGLYVSVYSVRKACKLENNDD